MADERLVLVHDESGDEYEFTSKSEYLSAFYAGGYSRKTDKRPAERPAQPRRDPVNSAPTVEHPAQK